MIEFGHLSHVGLRRQLNEDTYYGDGELGLWLVADGMGGHACGEIASALAREAIVREVRNGTALPQAIRLADEEIIRRLAGYTVRSKVSCRKVPEIPSDDKGGFLSDGGCQNVPLCHLPASLHNQLVRARVCYGSYGNYNQSVQPT